MTGFLDLGTIDRTPKPLAIGTAFQGRANSDKIWNGIPKRKAGALAAKMSL
jgi:hypothetical protein